MARSATRHWRRARRAPSPLLLRWRRLRRRMQRTFSGMLEERWTLSRQIGIERPRFWRPRWSALIFRIFVYLFAALLLAWFGRGVVAVFIGGANVWGPDIDAVCAGKGVSCGAVTGFV